MYFLVGGLTSRDTKVLGVTLFPYVCVWSFFSGSFSCADSPKVSVLIWLSIAISRSARVCADTV